jgi:hypothetical protein
VDCQRHWSGIRDLWSEPLSLHDLASASEFATLFGVHVDDIEDFPTIRLMNPELLTTGAIAHIT